MPEELAHQAFGPVPPNRPSDSARRDDSQPAPVQTVRKREQNQVAALDADTLPLHAEELPPPSNPVAPGKIPVHVSPAAAITRPGACGRSSTKPKAACAPWPGAVSGLPCRSSCSFACETRASACGADCWADTCASCSHHPRGPSRRARPTPNDGSYSPGGPDVNGSRSDHCPDSRADSRLSSPGDCGTFSWSQRRSSPPLQRGFPQLVEKTVEIEVPPLCRGVP